MLLLGYTPWYTEREYKVNEFIFSKNLLLNIYKKIDFFEGNYLFQQKKCEKNTFLVRYGIYRPPPPFFSFRVSVIKLVSKCFHMSCSRTTSILLNSKIYGQLFYCQFHLNLRTKIKA